MSRVLPGNLTNIPVCDRQLIRNNHNVSDPILIVGMHNSGTSILAKILHESGVFLGNNMDHYESHFFSIFINDLIIMQGGKNWAKSPIMPIEEVLSYAKTVGPFIKTHWIADYLQWGYDGKSMWGIKDPRICVLLPLYLEVFPSAKIIHIRRNSKDVAASLCNRNKRAYGKFDDFNHWLQVTIEYTNRVLEYSTVAKSYHEISYEDFCINTEDITKKLFSFLKIDFTIKTSQLIDEVSTTPIGSFERYQRQKMKDASTLKKILSVLRLNERS